MPDETEQLRQQLRDEAAWRGFVEQQLESEAEKALVWRERAEARAARIDRITARGSIRSRLGHRFSRSEEPYLRLPDVDATIAATAAALTPEPGRRPAHPEVRAAVLVVDADASALADEVDRRNVTVGGVAMNDADIIIIDDEGWRQHPDAARVLAAVLDGPARPAVLWLGTPAEDARALLTDRDAATLGTGPWQTLDLAPWARWVLPAGLPAEHGAMRAVEAAKATLLGDARRPALALIADATPAGIVLALAGAGIAVVNRDGLGAAGLPSATSGPLKATPATTIAPAMRRLAIAQRRAVAATGTAAARMSEVLLALSIPHDDHAPRLAALLSSNRPSLVPAQLARLGSQTRRPDVVAIALHGGSSASESYAVDEAAAVHGITIERFAPPSARPLGAVLNDLAAASGTELLAKIDDDDHYGPAHLEDATAALARTGADLVGKKAHYVHLTADDATYLVAGGEEDTWATQGLMGATFVWRRGLMDTVRFSPRPRRVDSLYVRALAAAGARMWALPANDFAYVRSGDGGTNPAGAAFVRARGVAIGRGLPLDIVDV